MTKFIRLDADNIGDKIEFALLNNEIESANSIHDSVQRGIQALQRILNSDSRFKILMTGCDDLLFEFNGEPFDYQIIAHLRDTFKNESGQTISLGIGDTLQEAIINLTIAKYAGKDRVWGI